MATEQARGQARVKAISHANGQANGPQSPAGSVGLPVISAASDCRATSRWHALGLVALLCIVHRETCLASVRQLVQRVRPAIECGRALLLVDSVQRPYAYTAWAVMSAATHRRMLDGDTLPSHPLALHNDGGRHLWFMDVICPNRTPSDVLGSLRAAFPAFDAAHARLPAAAGASTACAEAVRVW